MTLTLDQHRNMLAIAAACETGAVRAMLAATGTTRETQARAELDQVQAHYRNTRAAFDAAFILADAERRNRRAARALAAAVTAEIDGPLLEALQDNAADAWARYATIAGAQSPATVSAP